jgi:hypothetical protein
VHKSQLGIQARLNQRSAPASTHMVLSHTFFLEGPPQSEPARQGSKEEQRDWKKGEHVRLEVDGKSGELQLCHQRVQCVPANVTRGVVFG